MAYMRDSTGRRLDTFPAISATEAVSQSGPSPILSRTFPGFSELPVASPRPFTALGSSAGSTKIVTSSTYSPGNRSAFTRFGQEQRRDTAFPNPWTSRAPSSSGSVFGVDFELNTVSGYFDISLRNARCRVWVNGQVLDAADAPTFTCPVDGSTYRGEVALGYRSRRITDGATNTDNTFTSATAAFTADDVGLAITAPGVPTGTTISAVTSATQVTLSAATTATASGLTATFSRPGAYAIRIEFDQVMAASGWFGVTVSRVDTVAASPKRRPRIPVVGDSFTEPTISDTGSVYGWQGWVTQLSYALALDMVPYGWGGTGVLADNNGTRAALPARMSGILSVPGDAIVFALGINDYNLASYSYQTMRDTYISCLTQARAVYPAAKQIIVVGPFLCQGYSSITARLLDCNDACRAAAAAVGAVFVDVLTPPVDGAVSTTLAAAASAGATHLRTTDAISLDPSVYYRVDSGATGSEIVRFLSASQSSPYNQVNGFSGPAHAAGAQVVQVDVSYVTGNGRVGATNLSGNADLVRGVDGTHPSRWGMRHHARYVGGRLALAWST